MSWIQRVRAKIRSCMVKDILIGNTQYKNCELTDCLQVESWFWNNGGPPLFQITKTWIWLKHIISYAYLNDGITFPVFLHILLFLEVKVLHYANCRSQVSEKKSDRIFVKTEVIYLIVMFVLGRLWNPSSPWTIATWSWNTLLNFLSVNSMLYRQDQMKLSPQNTHEWTNVQWT